MATLAENMFLGLKEIWAAFTFDLSILWILTPIFIIWIFLEVYFGLFKSEKLGWNNVLGNGISLMWIGVDAMRYIFSAARIGDFWLRFIIFGIMILYSMLVIYISFTRKLGEFLSYALGSTTPIYFLSFVAVLWSYGQLVIDRWVFLDLLSMFILLLVIFFIFRRLLPRSVLDMPEEQYVQQDQYAQAQPTQPVQAQEQPKV